MNAASVSPDALDPIFGHLTALEVGSYDEFENHSEVRVEAPITVAKYEAAMNAARAANRAKRDALGQPTEDAC